MTCSSVPASAPRRLRRLAWLSWVLAGTVLLAGCGGSDAEREAEAARAAQLERLKAAGLMDADAETITFDQCIRRAMQQAQEAAGTPPSSGSTREWVQRYTAEGERIGRECYVLLPPGESGPGGGGFGASPFSGPAIPSGGPQG